MHHTQNLINLVVLPIGMISQQIIDNLLSAFHLRKTREVEALVAVEEMERRHMEVVPPAPLRISTLKMNRHSPLSTIKQPLPVGVAVLLEEEEAREVRPHTVREVVIGEDAAVRLLPEVIKIAVVDGEAGGTGTRFVFPESLCLLPSNGVQNNRTRESSVVISPQWSMLEEIEFHRLAKLRLEVDEPDELYVLLLFMVFVLHIFAFTEIRMAGCLPTKSPMIVSRPKRNGPYNL